MNNKKKSNLPSMDDLGKIASDVTGVAGKLFTDLKKSISEIICDLKEKRAARDADSGKVNSAAEKQGASQPTKTANATQVTTENKVKETTQTKITPPPSNQTSRTSQRRKQSRRKHKN